MIFSRGRVIGFGVAGMGLLVAVIFLTDRDQWEDMDWKTGEPQLAPEETLATALSTGDAKISHRLLVQGKRQSEALRKNADMLEWELMAPNLEGPPKPIGFWNMPASDLARNQILDRKTPWTPLALLPLLRDLLQDRELSAALDEFFATPRQGAKRAPDARASSLSGGKIEPNQARALMRTFSQEDRTRAQLRWALTYWSMDPQASEAALFIVGELIRLGENGVALAVLDASSPLTEELEGRRAQVARWLSLPQVESSSMERLAQAGLATEEDRSRLVDLYLLEGEPGKGLPHALHLARAHNTPTSWETAIHMATEFGAVGEAIELCREAARSTGKTQPWLKKELQLLRADLRIDELRDRLITLELSDPKLYRADLEEILRGTDDRPHLLDYWYRRLQTTPDDGYLRRRVIGLALSEDRTDIITAILSRQFESSSTPGSDLARLPILQQYGVEDARGRLLQALRSASFNPGDMLKGLQALTAMPWDEELYSALIVPLEDRQPPAELHVAHVGLLSKHQSDRVLLYLEDLNLRFPGNVPFLIDLAKNAMWQNARTIEIDSRLALLDLLPGDAENRAKLADAYILDRQPQKALETVTSQADVLPMGQRSAVAQRAALEAAVAMGDGGRVWRWSAEILANGLAPLSIWNLCAESLMTAGYPDEARRAWEACLERADTFIPALEGLGNHHLSRKEASLGRPYLERMWTLEPDPTHRQIFLLAEARRETGDDQGSIELYQKLLDDPAGQSTFSAKALLRLGRSEEGLQAMRKIAEESPNQVRLWIDLVDENVKAGRHERALEFSRLTVQLKPLDPKLCLETASIEMTLGRYEEAEESLVQALELGADPGRVALVMSEVQRKSGQLAAAAETLERHIQLDGPTDPDAHATLQSLRERMRPMVGVYASQMKAGNDSMMKWALVGSAQLNQEHTRLFATVTQLDFEGHWTPPVPGPGILEDSISAASLGWMRDRGNEKRFTLGVTVFPDAPGTDDGAGSVGAWGAHRWGSYEVGVQSSLRLGLEELWTDPVAAAGLGGRESSLQWSYMRQQEGHSWWHVQVHLGQPTIQVGSDELDETLVEASLGWGTTLLGKSSAMAEASSFPHFDRLPDSPYLGKALEDSGEEHLEWWLALEQQKLLGDGVLASRLPIADNASYALTGLSYDRRLAPGFGTTIGGQLGFELDSASFTQSLEAGFTWRPNFGTEVLLRGSTGDSMGRANEDEFHAILLGIHLRL
ncbi:MAG: hypothetical protein GY930_03430 [bacterium]|nr:hypothetical protein [bacterium]